MAPPTPAPRRELSMVRRRLRSFSAAFRGLAVVLGEVHSRVHLAATLVVLAAGWWFHLSTSEWCAVIVAMGIVWVAEALNTALEHLADAAVPEQHPLVGAAKDSAAAGVLIAALTSVAIAALVFLPKLH